MIKIKDYGENVITSVDQIESNVSNLIVVKTASGKNVVLKVVPSNEQIHVMTGVAPKPVKSTISVLERRKNVRAANESDQRESPGFVDGQRGGGELHRRGRRHLHTGGHNQGRGQQHGRRGEPHGRHLPQREPV